MKTFLDTLARRLHFGARELVVFLLASLIFLALTTLVYKHIEQRYQENLLESLDTVLQSVSEGMEIWGGEHIKDVESLIYREDILVPVRKLLAEEPNPDVLLDSLALEEVRDYFRPFLMNDRYRGFFIIGPDNINLASSRDSNVGTINLLVEQPDVLAKLWSGNSALAEIQFSDVPLSEEGYRNPNHHDLTMFVGAPIKDDEDKVIALLTLRLAPERGLFRALNKGRVGRSGEAYIFNKQGIMLSQSRFIEDLSASGLIEKKTANHGALHIELRDPDENLMKTKRPLHLFHDRPYTKMASSAIQGESGRDIEGYRDYRGVPVVGVWMHNTTLGVGLAVEQDYDEAYSLLSVIRDTMYVYAGIAVGVLLGIIILFGLWRTNPRD